MVDTDTNGLLNFAGLQELSNARYVRSNVFSEAGACHGRLPSSAEHAHDTTRALPKRQLKPQALNPKQKKTKTRKQINPKIELQPPTARLQSGSCPGHGPRIPLLGKSAEDVSLCQGQFVNLNAVVEP